MISTRYSFDNCQIGHNRRSRGSILTGDGPRCDKRPALFTHDEVLTLFHEFGHGLHHLLTRIEDLGVSGINIANASATLALGATFSAAVGDTLDVVRATPVRRRVVAHAHS